MTSNNPIRKTMSLIDENKECLPEGVYLEICESLIQPRGMIESLLFNTHSPSMSGISLQPRDTHIPQTNTMDHDSHEIIPSPTSAFNRTSTPARIGRR